MLTLSETTTAFLIARLSQLLKIKIEKIEKCYTADGLVIVEARDIQQREQRFTISSRDFLSVRLMDNRPLGYLESQITFMDPDAFACIALPGPAVCSFADGEITLIGSNARYQVRMAANNGAIVYAKCNYSKIITSEHLAKLNMLIRETINNMLLQHFGLFVSETQAINETEPSECSTAGSSTDTKTTRSDRCYIELLVKHNPKLMEVCIYYDANYPIDRANMRTLISYIDDDDGNNEVGKDHNMDFVHLGLTPRIGQMDAGFYIYDVGRGLWLPCSNISIEEFLIQSILRLPELTQQDIKYLDKESKAAMLRRVFAKKIESASLNLVKRSLNSINYLALGNGAIVEDGKLRQSNASDAVFVSTGWSYDPELAKSKRSEVERFLNQVFPLRDEQRVVLEYIADLLEGHRQKKGFLILTDKRHGNNGKSAFLKLLGSFFGEAYYAKSVKFITSNTHNDKNSHDSNMESMNGKRLLVCDEFTKHIHLDTALIKDLVSVPDTIIQGRRFGRANTFKFIWQAGLILSFNEDQVPKFDTNDHAFLNRMIVCNMRSKFLVKTDYDRYRAIDPEPYTFLADVNIVSRFESWNSAFLDILLETRNSANDRSLDLPKSMIESRDEMVLSIRDYDGQLCEWLHKLIENELKHTSLGEYMNKNVLVISAMDIYTHYSAQRLSYPLLHLDTLKREAFIEKIETICNTQTMQFRNATCLFKRRYQLRKNGTNQQRRKVVVINIKQNNN